MKRYIVPEQLEEIHSVVDAFRYLLPNSEYDRITRLTYLNDLPKRFNRVFMEHGWIMTDDFSVDIAEEAIRINDRDGIGAAEEFLCDQFDEEYFEKNIPRMSAIWVFPERRGILDLAFQDHHAGRYHASIPVVLSQIDGLTQDLAAQSFYISRKHETRVFRRPSKVTGLESNLDLLANRMNSSRNKTTQHPLAFPYRNGILHGRDINYGNRIVSTKSFFTFFALRPWALFIQRNELAKRQGEEYEEIEGLKAGKKLTEYLDSILKTDPVKGV